MVNNNDMAHSLWSDIVASRFELLLFAVSCIGYIIVLASRRGRKSAKDTNCKADFSLEYKQVEAEETSEVSAYDAAQQSQDYDSELVEDGADVQTAITELLDKEEFDKACDIFEMNYDTFFDVDIDEDMEKRLLMSALKCGRQSLAEHLLETSQTDFSKHVKTIQNWWKRSAAKISETRVEHMHDVLGRMAELFNELHPFEEDEHSDAESTCAMGAEDSNDGDSDWDDSELMQ